MYLRILLLITSVLITSSTFAQQGMALELGGNAFVTHAKTAKITEDGIEDWTDPKEVINFYVRVGKPGTLDFSINETTQISGRSVVEFSIGNEAKKVIFDEAKKSDGVIGSWEIKDTGYVKVTLKGISKTKANFPSIKQLHMSGSAINKNTSYVKNNEGNYFYWGRRGPSVHLNYKTPDHIDAEWFYNEITVPKSNDVIGSYFMANGFGEGYFGMQVNSSTERRVLFSVWSPFNTDNPKEIPESHKIILLKKGRDVHTGEFGNEGSGGQSYLKYNWKAGNTYRFLLHASPSTGNYTTYTAYFFAPEQGEWRLIASFKRPQTQTYLKRLHSFLENFIPETGDKTRMALYTNQWIYSTKGEWHPLNAATFTIDNTGKMNYRKDYAGGLAGNGYFLKNCGFFNDYTVQKSYFTQISVNQNSVGDIDFSKLP